MSETAQRDQTDSSNSTASSLNRVPYPAGKITPSRSDAGSANVQTPEAHANASYKEAEREEHGRISETAHDNTKSTPDFTADLSSETNTPHTQAMEEVLQRQA